jgi:hypothetical protein
MSHVPSVVPHTILIRSMPESESGARDVDQSCRYWMLSLRSCAATATVVIAPEVSAVQRKIGRTNGQERPASRASIRTGGSGHRGERLRLLVEQVEMVRGLLDAGLS